MKSDQPIPQKDDVVIESIFSFDEAAFNNLTIDERQNFIDVIQRILNDLTFQLQLEKHTPKK